MYSPQSYSYPGAQPGNNCNRLVSPESAVGRRTAVRAIPVEAYASPSDVVKVVDVPDLEPMIAWRLETTKRRPC